jgi:TolB protein
MFAHRPKHPTQEWRRVPGAAFLALALAISGCDGDQPLAPADQDSAADAATPVASGETAALVVTSQRIVFTSNRNGGQFDIYKIDPAGQNTFRITSKSDRETEPALSWDNKRVALVRPRINALNQMRYDIWVVNADGTNGHWARSATSTADLGHPSWSPSGSKLAVTMALNGQNYVAYLNLTTGQLSAYSTGYGGLPGSYPTYTPSGQIVYVGGTGKTIDRINGDGSGHKTLLTSTMYMAQPALSPDGNKLLYVRAVDDFLNTEIFLRNLATSTTKQLTISNAPDGQPTWSPDGSRIAFMSGRTGVAQIWTMDATGGTLKRVTQTTSTEAYPSWSH